MLALSPVLLGVFATVAWWRFLKNVEELYKKLIIEAAATAFAITFLLFLSLGIVRNIFGGSSDIEWGAIIFCIMLLTFVVSLNVRIRGVNA